MDDIIVISNLNYCYNQKVVFKNLNLNIKRGSFTSIIGPNGSGKSTLMKLIVGLMKSDSFIQVDGLAISSETYKEIRKNIGFVFENPDNQFVAETVMDEIAFSLENMNYDKKEIRSRVKEVGVLLNIEHLMEKEPHSLSGGEKQLVALAGSLSIKPKILILDEALEMLDQHQKENILNILVKLNKEQNMTIINITHNSEDLLYGTDIVVLNDGELIEQGSKIDVLRNEKAFKKNKLELPFIVDLSNKLKYYGLVDDIVLDMDELVDIIWK